MSVALTITKNDAHTYCEASISAGQDVSEVRRDLMEKFKLSEAASKSLVFASRSFNCGVSYSLWLSLKETSLTEAHLTKRFMRKFKLEEHEAVWLLEEFSKGKAGAVGELRKFEDLAKSLLSECAQEELKSAELLK